MKVLEYGTAFAAGACIYTLLEIIWRGYTHWTMTLTGGICLVLMYMWNNVLTNSSLPFKCLIGALSITVVEFAVGCIVNIGFGQAVWDYSNLRFNILGQVCLYFSLIWYVLSIPGFYLCDFIKDNLQLL